MKPNNSGRRPTHVAAALGAVLLTAGCAGSMDPLYAGLPSNLDGGVGQLLRYCSKFQNSGDLVTAAGLCERAHWVDPTNPAPLMQLADILLAMEQPDRAIAAYQAIIEIAPNNADARYALGKAYIAVGRYELATAQFRAALFRTTDDPRIYNALGVAYGLLEANESALQAFEAGLEVDPKHMSLRNNMGLSLVLAGRYEEGVKVLEAAAADPRANITSHDNLQLAYGMISAARADQTAAALLSAGDDASRDTRVAVQATQITSASERPDPEPKDQPAAAPVATDDEAVTPGAPVPLIKEFQREQAYKGDREVEIPIKVTVTDTPADSGEVPAPSNGQANSAWNSPLLWQTARVDYGDLEDSGAPSATMSDYITTEAILDETPAEPSEPSYPAASASEVAALQSIAPTGTEAGIERIYAVQLASYLSEERAMRGWTELRAIAPDLLDPLEPVVRRADLDEGESTVYRLRTAPATKDDAKELCTELRSRGLDCLVIKEAPANTDGGSRSS